MPKITNKTGGSAIAREAKVCRSVLSKARGLMFSKKKDLIFQFAKASFVPLHMFFVFFPIDVLFLDNDKRIIEIKKDFRPFAYYRPRKRAFYVIELSTQESRKSGYNLGDRLGF